MSSRNVDGRHVTHAIAEAWSHAIQTGTADTTVDRFVDSVCAHWRARYARYLASTCSIAADVPETKWPAWARQTAADYRAEFNNGTECWARALAMFHPGVNELLESTERQCAPVRRHEAFDVWLCRWIDYVATTPWLRAIERVYGTSAQQSTSTWAYQPVIIETWFVASTLASTSAPAPRPSKSRLCVFPNYIVFMLARTHIANMFRKRTTSASTASASTALMFRFGATSAGAGATASEFCACDSTLKWCERYRLEVVHKTADDTSALNYKRTVMWADADTSEMACEHVSNILRRVL